MLSETCHAAINEASGSASRENEGVNSSEDTGVSLSTTLSCSGAASSLADEKNPVASLIPIIPHCEEFKYYRAPEGLKRLRNKRKVALLFAYIGERYCGLQWNHLPQFPTVEEAILKALFEADMISLTNISNVKVQQLLNFERASRTDKGVHALCNVISVNVMLPYDPEYVTKERQRLADTGSNPANGRQEVVEEDEVGVVTEKTNKADKVVEVLQKECAPAHTPPTEQAPRYSLEEGKRVLRRALPEDIHLYDIVPVTRSFNAYLCCGGRRYEYFLPTFALLTPQEYSETYFPAAVAPSSPSLKEVGFKLGKIPPTQNKQQRTEVQEALESSCNARGEEYGKEDNTSTSGIPSSGRRSKGHFPKSKKRRLQYAEKKEEQLLAEKEAARQAENEDRKRREEERLSVSSVQVAGHDGVPTPLQGEGGEELDQERLFTKAHCALPPSEEKRFTEEEMEKIEELSVDRNDPIAVEAFLSTHRATHFQDHLFPSMILFRTIPPETMKQVAKYRISSSQLEHVRSLFHLYEGTHCYHNFTPGGRSTDASCHRYMKSITVGEPIVWKPDDALLEKSIENWTPSRFFAPDEQLTEACEEAREEVQMTESSRESPSCGHQEDAKKRKMEEDMRVREKLRAHLRQFYPDGIEVVRIELDGQSFMLNQIRKMIGAVIGITVAGLPPSFLLDTLLRKGVHQPIPMVPANGLLLSYLDFSGYGNRLTRIQRNGANGTGKEGIDMEALMPAQEVEEQEQRTVSVILRNEMGSDLMGKWMRSLRHAIHLAWKKEIP